MDGGDCDAAIAAAVAAAVTYVQSLGQEVGSGDEGLGLFRFDINGGLLPDIILLTQCYYHHRGTRLNAMKRFYICSL